MKIGDLRSQKSKSCVWTRCSTQEYVAHNYILHKVLKYESRKKAPPGGRGRGDGQTVFWSIEVKRIFAKKGTKKSLEKKRASEKGFSTAIMHYAFFLH